MMPRRTAPGRISAWLGVSAGGRPVGRLGIIESQPSRWPWSLGLALFGVLTAMACMRYLALRSTVFDLGVFVCNLTAMGQDGQWWRAFNGHVQPVLWLFSLVTKALPDWLDPLGLMVTQAFFLALPLPFLTVRYGGFTALAYMLSFAVWHNGLFDFHPDHLAIPIGFWFFFSEKDDRPWMAALAALSLCLIKETFALQAAACGVFLMSSRRGGPAGVVVLVLSLFWFWLSTSRLIPFFTLDGEVGLAAGAFSWMGGGGVLSKLGYLLLHPLTSLGHIFGDIKKVKYIVALLGSVAFLPLLAPRALLVALPPLILSMLSTRPDYYSISNHYTAGLVAPLIIAFASALPLARSFIEDSRWRVDRWAGVLLLVLVGAHIVLSPSPFSVQFWRHGGLSGYFPTERTKRIIRALETTLPSDPETVIITQNSLNWGKIVSRNFSNSFPLATFTPHKAQDMRQVSFADVRRFVFNGQKPVFPIQESLAEYLVLDRKRPWFVVDQGCEWQDGACRNLEVAAVFTENVDRAMELFEVVLEDDGFMILKRRQP